MATSATVDTYSVIGADLKTVFGKLKDDIPVWAHVQDMVGFDQANMVGDQFVEAVILTSENGVTYGLISDGAITLENAVAMNVQQAKVNPPQVYTQSQVDVTMISRSMGAGAGGNRQAFANATDLVVKSAMKTMR